MNKRELNWGTPIRPTKEAVKNVGIGDDVFAFYLGKANKNNNEIILVREGKKSVERWAESFWEKLPR